MALRGNALERAIADARAAQRETRLALAATRLAAARESLAALERMSPEAFHVCVAVRLVSGSQDFALRWARLHLEGRAFGGPSSDVDEARLAARLGTELGKPALVARLLDPLEPVHSRAARWCAEWSVFQWLVCMNWKGVAPPSSALVLEYLDRFPAASAGGCSAYHCGQLRASPDAGRRWVRGFRRRWRGSYRKLPTGSVLSDAEISEKAPPPVCQDLGSRRAPTRRPPWPLFSRPGPSKKTRLVSLFFCASRRGSDATSGYHFSRFFPGGPKGDEERFLLRSVASGPLFDPHFCSETAVPKVGTRFRKNPFPCSGNSCGRRSVFRRAAGHRKWGPRRSLRGRPKAPAPLGGAGGGPACRPSLPPRLPRSSSAASGRAGCCWSPWPGRRWSCSISTKPPCSMSILRGGAT